MSTTLGPLGSAFASYIRSAAASKKLRQAEVAERAGIPRDTFGRYWRGEREVTIDQMAAIITALGDDFDDVLDELRRTLRK